MHITFTLSWSQKILTLTTASLVAQSKVSAVQETRLQSLGREDPLEKEWQPIPIFLPGESHGWRSLVGYSPWGPKESDTTSLSLSATSWGPSWWS